jgi:hypothetical protein
MASAKAEQIVDRMTSDPQIKADVLSMIDEIQANPGEHNVDSVIARFTSDPELTATIKEQISAVAAGKSMQSIAASLQPGGGGSGGGNLEDTADATVSTTAGNMSAHKSAVEDILAS